MRLSTTGWKSPYPLSAAEHPPSFAPSMASQAIALWMSRVRWSIRKPDSWYPSPCVLYWPWM